MSIRRGGAILAAAFILLLPSSAGASAPTYVSYVGCSDWADAAPAHACQLGEQLGAFFEVTNRPEIQFQTCIGRPGHTDTCTAEQMATALTPLVLRFRPLQVGSFEVAWRVEGRQVGSWLVNITSTAKPFTTEVASESLRYKVLAEAPDARFLTPGGPLCPRIDPGRVPRSLCFAEFRTGRLRNLFGYTVGGKGDQLSLRYRVKARWFRRWVPCPLKSLPGVLVSNNNCGYHQPQNDEDLLRSQALADIRAGRPLRSVHWTFAESTGFNALGLYRVTRKGGSYVFRNSLGDGFRYRP